MMFHSDKNGYFGEDDTLQLFGNGSWAITVRNFGLNGQVTTALNGCYGVSQLRGFLNSTLCGTAHKIAAVADKNRHGEMQNHSAVLSTPALSTPALFTTASIAIRINWTSSTSRSEPYVLPTSLLANHPGPR
jgi:hypothetical protein